MFQWDAPAYFYLLFLLLLMGDGDHTDDYSELRLHLDPLDSTSFFALSADVSGTDTLTLEWPSAPGLSFNVLSSADLSEPLSEWDLYLPGIAADETLSATSVELPILGERRFFAIELQHDE